MKTDAIIRLIETCYALDATIQGVLKTEGIEDRAVLAEAEAELEALETAIAAKDDALRVGLGWATGGMEGEWRNCDHIEVMRAAITSEPTGNELEAIARKLLGINGVPAAEQERVIKRAAQADRDAVRLETIEECAKLVIKMAEIGHDGYPRSEYDDALLSIARDIRALAEEA